IKISVSGVTGGHSGIEINKQGANADKVLGRALNYLNKSEDVYFNLVDIFGGLKDNAIPKESYAVFDVYLEEDTKEQVDFIYKIICDIIKSLNKILKHEYDVTDKEICLNVEQIKLSDETPDEDMVNFYADYKNPTDDVIALLVALPNGVRKMSHEIDGLVETSLNLGIMNTEKIAMTREIEMSFSVRSSIGSEKEELIDTIECLVKAFDGEVTISGDYPAWEYKKDSVLRDVMYDAYVDLFGKKPNIEAVHAGLECGIFSGKIKELDCVSIGPRMEAIHTTDEKLYIESTKRYWKYVLEILKRLK
ncbi:MAG: M20/M25/M40 family metallo-hydrolase, partial [Lachnospiraceae bacterium]|nr:M20/M25/M40 family metallo-hydrolase [Lachnospiraceae bacterium]